MTLRARDIITITVSFLFVLAVASMGHSAPAAGEIIITHASMSTSSIPLWVAQRQNFFGKYGVKAKTVWVRGNPAQIASAIELVLEGLHLNRKLNKDRSAGRMRYRS